MSKFHYVENLFLVVSEGTTKVGLFLGAERLEDALEAKRSVALLGLK